MNKLLLLCIIFFSTTVSAIHFSVIEGKYDCPKIDNSMRCARSIEQRLIKKHPFIQRMTDKVLLVALPTGEDKKFNDAQVSYSAIDYVEAFGYLILVRQYWEGDGYSLLNLRTGAIQEVEGYPLFSPSGKYAVIVNKDLEAGYSPNTLQLYKTNPNWTLVFDAKAEQWGPGKVSWLNETTVSFEKTRISEHHDALSENKALSERYSKEPALLKKAGSQWAITLNNPSTYGNDVCPAYYYAKKNANEAISPGVSWQQLKSALDEAHTTFKSKYADTTDDNTLKIAFDSCKLISSELLNGYANFTKKDWLLMAGKLRQCDVVRKDILKKHGKKHKLFVSINEILESPAYGMFLDIARQNACIYWHTK